MKVVVPAVATVRGVIDGLRYSAGDELGINGILAVVAEAITVCVDIPAPGRRLVDPAVAVVVHAVEDFVSAGTGSEFFVVAVFTAVLGAFNAVVVLVVVGVAIAVLVHTVVPYLDGVGVDAGVSVIAIPCLRPGTPGRRPGARLMGGGLVPVPVHATKQAHIATGLRFVDQWLLL